MVSRGKRVEEEVVGGVQGGGGGDSRFLFILEHGYLDPVEEK